MSAEGAARSGERRSIRRARSQSGWTGTAKFDLCISGGQILPPGNGKLNRKTMELISPPSGSLQRVSFTLHEIADSPIIDGYSFYSTQTLTKTTSSNTPALNGTRWRRDHVRPIGLRQKPSKHKSIRRRLVRTDEVQHRRVAGRLDRDRLRRISQICEGHRLPADVGRQHTGNAVGHAPPVRSKRDVGRKIPRVRDAPARAPAVRSCSPLWSAVIHCHAPIDSCVRHRRVDKVDLRPARRNRPARPAEKNTHESVC